LARTVAEWTAARDLVDVRPDGADTKTFSGESIEDNTWVVAEPYELSSDAGIDVGVGYDFVLDCDQDGLLGPADYIDGFSDEAGGYVVHDMTERGPLATTVVEYDGVHPLLAFQVRARLYYPTNIADLGPRPVVIIGHGGGHRYYWYDYLQDHLASYGFICMSHQNHFTMGSGIPHVLPHTEALISGQATIADGALNGLIDETRIAWIGHSLGGQEVVLACNDVMTGVYEPEYFTRDSLKVTSAIGAVSLVEDAGGGGPANGVYHVLYGSADGDVTGEADCDMCQPFRHLDRGTGFKQSTYVHGADHNDFNCCGFENFDGPPETEIGREEAQQVAKAVYLALMKHYLEGNIPAKDYLWRQWERFRPMGVADSTIVVSTYSEPSETGKYVIEDYQTGESLTLSSAGGEVTYNVSNLFEGRLDDNDDTFVWAPSDPMNGMTYGGDADTTRGAVFDWAIGQERFMQFEVPVGDGDFRPFKYLSFRACQGTQHPETVAELGDLSFTVTLIDATGAESSMNIGAYGGGIEEVYQRAGGWQNEFETIRLRLTDFLNNGSDLNLSDVAAVRFDFGGSFGSSRGRLGFDDLEVTKD
jgi:hypothetical protein